MGDCEGEEELTWRIDFECETKKVDIFGLELHQLSLNISRTPITTVVHNTTHSIDISLFLSLYLLVSLLLDFCMKAHLIVKTLEVSIVLLYDITKHVILLLECHVRALPKRDR